MPDVLRQPPDPSTVARPLRVLVPLIEQDLKHGREAAERAGLPYYRAAGEKLLEAKSQLPHGEFTAWVHRHFTVSGRMARHYMNLAEAAARENGNAFPFSSLNAFIRQRTTPTVDRPVQPTGRIDVGQLAKEYTRRGAEQKAVRRLVLKAFEIGYKALAQQLHPDKGGSAEDMARLNAARQAIHRAFDK